MSDFFFPETARERNEAKNPFRVLVTNLVVGDIVHIAVNGNGPGTTWLITSVAKKKFSAFITRANGQSKFYESPLTSITYINCTHVLREGQVCSNIHELRNAR